MRQGGREGGRRECESERDFCVCASVQSFGVYVHVLHIRESVDSLCRDGSDTPIVRVHTKAF